MGLAKELRARRAVSRRRISVAEWADSEGNPFVFFARPISCNDMEALNKRHKNFINNPTLGAMVDLIILKAEHEDGAKCFTAADDRAELMGAETDIISEIAGQMFADIVSAEAHEKN